MSEIKCTYPITNIWRKSTYIEDPKIAKKMTILFKTTPKGRKQSKRSEEIVLNKTGGAPQCSCTIGECTNMESSLPQNHLEHTTSARAVSYTHLRAHETDSYLVCRLLLEKKK